MIHNFQKTEDSLKNNIEDVYKLISFDRLILDFSLTALKELKGNLESAFDIDNPRMLAENTIGMIENVRENNSLRPHYKIMFNQSIVLLVSVFASAVADLFRDGVNQLAKLKNSKELMKEEFKLTVDEIMEHGKDLPNRIGYVIADKKDISFQDMKSIGRAFREYFSVSMDKTEAVNNIIFSQAARHVIVHDSGRVNERILNQVRGANPRKIKNNLSNMSYIEFSPDEVKVVGDSMLKYFNELRVKVEKRLNDQS